MHIVQSRRDFLTSASSAAAAGFLGARASVADEAPPETTTIRLATVTNICIAPTYFAAELLRAEGFTDVRYIPAQGGFTAAQMIGHGEIDFGMTLGASLVAHLDAGAPLTVIGGVHSGCYELFAREHIHTITNLKGKSVGIQTLSSSAHLYLSIMAAHVGLNPQTDINWVTSPAGDASEPMELYAAGKDRCVSRLPARATGAAGARHRARDHQDRHGPPLVAVLLLHAGRQSGVRPRSSGRHQTCSACRAQGGRSLRRRAGTGRAPAGGRGVTPRLDFALQTMNEVAYDSGATTTRRTRSASTRFNCAKRA